MFPITEVFKQSLYIYTKLTWWKNIAVQLILNNFPMGIDFSGWRTFWLSGQTEKGLFWFRCFITLMLIPQSICLGRICLKEIKKRKIMFLSLQNNIICFIKIILQKRKLSNLKLFSTIIHIWKGIRKYDIICIKFPRMKWARIIL